MSVHTVKAQPDHQYIDPVTGRRYTTPPSDHMLLSVLALLFCMMWPTIFCAALSVIYSFQVSAYDCLYCQYYQMEVTTIASML